jgi:hypothetical protein
VNEDIWLGVGGDFTNDNGTGADYVFHSDLYIPASFLSIGILGRAKCVAYVIPPEMFVLQRQLCRRAQHLRKNVRG